MSQCHTHRHFQNNHKGIEPKLREFPPRDISTEYVRISQESDYDYDFEFKLAQSYQLLIKSKQSTIRKMKSDSENSP